MITSNTIDWSEQLTGYVEKNISTRFTLFATATINIGGRNSEFGELFERSILAGVKLFVF